MLRIKPLVVAVTLLLWGCVWSLAEAQQRRQRERDVPFGPSGEFFRQFEQFMTGDNEAEQRELDAVSVPADDERKFGQQMVAAYVAQLKRQRLKVLRQGTDVEYLEALVAELQPLMKNAARYPRITVYVIDSPETDARSFPGGTLFFYRGILDFAENEAALMTIVGHELSHLDRGHQLLPLKQARMFADTFSDAQRGFDLERFFRTGMTMTRLLSRPFRPEDEAAADQDGVAWAYRAGYDPRQLARLFVRLHERDRGKERGMPSFFRTHPYAIDRSAAVERQYEELQAKEPRSDLYIGQENLERRIPRSLERFE